VQRTKTVVHELFHLLQGEVAWPGPRGGWLHEGSAEYVGYAATIEWGMATYTEVRDCQTANYFGAGGPSAPALPAISFEPTSPVLGRYIIAWHAWDRLLRGPGNLARLVAYWTGSFESAFGIGESQFYTDFEQYRNELRQPGGNACAGLNSR
jgi:hypothetical protein